MLEVDNAVVLPIDTHIRYIITGADVLHDWAVPALALKLDIITGKRNRTFSYCIWDNRFNHLNYTDWDINKE
jgi:cytochrome c oxidase subunit 2